MFLVEVEIFDQHKLQKALKRSAVVYPEIFIDGNGEYEF